MARYASPAYVYNYYTNLAQRGVYYDYLQNQFWRLRDGNKNRCYVKQGGYMVDERELGADEALQIADKILKLKPKDRYTVSFQLLDLYSRGVHHGINALADKIRGD